MTTWLAAAETRASATSTKWFHAYHEGDTDTTCGRPLEGLTPTGEQFLDRPSHCPRCDALTTTGAATPPGIDG